MILYKPGAKRRLVGAVPVALLFCGICLGSSAIALKSGAELLSVGSSQLPEWVLGSALFLLCLNSLRFVSIVIVDTTRYVRWGSYSPVQAGHERRRVVQAERVRGSVSLAAPAEMRGALSPPRPGEL